jgi:hypothetical protein
MYIVGLPVLRRRLGNFELLLGLHVNINEAGIELAVSFYDSVNYQELHEHGLLMAIMLDWVTM